MASNFSLLQKIYAGEKLETPVKLPTGANYQLQIYHASNRTFRSVIEGWKKEGFKYPIDWYIYDNLIRPCSIIAPSESAQIWILLKERGRFFKDPEWNRIKIDLSTYKISGIEEIERNRKEIKEALRKEEERKETHLFTPQEIAESASGRKMPEIELEIGKTVEMKDLIEKYQESLDLLSQTEEIIKEFSEECKTICPE